MKAKCITRCFYANREWLVGEVGDFDVEKAPPHFTAQPPSIPGIKVALPVTAPKETAADRANAGEPTTLAELAGLVVPKKPVDPVQSEIKWVAPPEANESRAQDLSSLMG